MTAANIAWIICLVLWVICFFMTKFANNRNEEGIALFFIAMQFLFLSLQWVFLGFGHGWW